MDELKIYKKEADLGLSEKLKDTSVALFADIIVKEESDISVASVLTGEEQKGLFSFEAILASTGWNGNDDVFGADELWAAKNTIMNKPLNYMHEGQDIIGHSISSEARDFDGSKIDKPQPDYDVAIGSVIYTVWQDDFQSGRVKEHIEYIKAGKYGVSMECRFSGFDYSLISPSGEHIIVQRNENTSHLTQHLRRFGGSGVYDGYRIGRFFRNIQFCGVGLVDRPANKRSKIVSFYSSKASLLEVPVEITKEQYDAVKAQLDVAKAETDRFQNELTKASELLESEKKAVAELTSTLDNEKALSAQKTEKLAELEASIASLKEELESKAEEVISAKAEILKRDRVSLLVEAGLDSTKAVEVFEKFQSASDEMFAEVVALQAKQTPSTEKDRAEAATEVLEASEVEENSSASLTVDSSNELHAVASEWLGNIFNKQ